MTERRVVILVGHGGVPADYPRAKVRRLMTLETERQASGAEPSDEELALDREIREHPRTPQNDPYKFGLEQLAHSLRAKLGGTPLHVAYNEFCAPSVPEAVADAIAAGANDVVLVTSMMTPGGLALRGRDPAAGGGAPSGAHRGAYPLRVAVRPRCARGVDGRAHRCARLKSQGLFG